MAGVTMWTLAAPIQMLLIMLPSNSNAVSTARPYLCYDVASSTKPVSIGIDLRRATQKSTAWSEGKKYAQCQRRGS
jgi:hypothetical protein